MAQEEFDLDSSSTRPGAEEPRTATVHDGDNVVAGDQLKAFVERIERMTEEKKAITDDIRDIYAEAKGNGFDVKVLRQVVRLRARDRNDVLEEKALLDLYLSALGLDFFN